MNRYDETAITTPYSSKVHDEVLKTNAFQDLVKGTPDCRLIVDDDPYEGALRVGGSGAKQAAQAIRAELGLQ
jgi:hypothetical protein